MGVLNVTPDSFSDGGLYATLDAAVARGLDMMTAGADLIDVGGESSRPGAEPVPVDVELDRVVPVVEALRAAPRTGRAVRLSVDTVKPEVATAALAAGASLVNDISASLWEVAAAAGAGWVAMHMQGQPRTMQKDPRYGAVVDEVRAFVLERARRALPGRGARGLGRPRHRIRQDDRPTTSRCCATWGSWWKGPPRRDAPGSWSGRAASASSASWRRDPGRSEPAPVADRAEGSLATEAAALVAGVGMLRVHDVAATVQMTRLYGPAA